MEPGNFVEKYNITDTVIAEMSTRCMALKVSGIDDEEGYNVVKTARIAVMHKRTDVEKKRKELKADAIKYGNAVDAEAKRITALLAPIENYLIQQETIVDAEKARIKKEKDDKEKAEIMAKVDALYAYGKLCQYDYVKEMTEEQYAAKLAEAKAEHAAIEVKKFEEACARQEEEKRLAAMRGQLAAEALRLETARKEQEAKDASVRKEQEAREAAIKAEHDKLDAEKAAIETAKRKEADRIAEAARIEQAKKEAAEKAVKDAELKAIAEKAEAERKEAERVAEEKRAEALRPDKEKLLAFAHSLELMGYPICDTETGKALVTSIGQLIEKVCKHIRKGVETL